jgi:hypothetical protein
VGKIFAENPDLEMVYGDTVFIDRASKFTRTFKTLPFHRWLLLNTFSYIPQPSAFWRRGLYERVGGIDPRLEVAMDPDLWLRFSEVTRLKHVRRYWSRMRLYPEIMSIARRGDNLAVYRMLEERYLGARPELLRTASRALARLIRVGYKLCLGCYWDGSKNR